MNFCPNCGKALEKNGKICSSCDQSIQETSSNVSEEQEDVSLTNESVTQGKKGFSKKWLIAAVIAAVLVVGTSAFAFIMMKSPKTLYLLAERNTFNQFVSDWNEKYGEVSKYQELFLDKPSSNELTVSGNLEVPKEDVTPEVEMVQEILAKMAFKINSKQDPIKNITKLNMGLEIDSAKTLDIDLYHSAELVEVKVPLLYDKSFYLKTDQYGRLMRMIDPYYEGPEKLDINSYIWNDLKLTDKEKDLITKRSGEFLLAELKEEMFTLRKNVEYEYAGETMKTREITLKLTEKQTKEIINKWIDHLMEDEELQKIIADRVVMIAKNSPEQFNEEQMNSKYVKKEFKKGLREIKKGLDDISIPKGFKSVILIDKKERIINRKVEFTIENPNFEDLMFKISSKNVPLKTKDSRDKEWKLEVLSESDPSSSLVLSVANDIRMQKANRTEEMKLSLFVEDNGYVEADMALDVHSKFHEFKNGKLDVKRDFELSLDGDSLSSPINAINGTIKQKGETNVKKQFSNQKIDFVLNIDDGNESGTLKLKVDSKSKIKNDLKITSINDDGLNIMELTEEDIYEIQEDMGTRFMELLEELGLYEDISSLYSGYDEYEYDEYEWEDDESI